MTKWNGEERRHLEDRRNEDHDLLVEVHTMLKSMKENYDKHVEDDEAHFGRLYKGQGKLTWLVAIGIGGVAVLKFLIK